MSAAFDTINRETLLKILEDIVNEDEHRIIRFLPSNTIINTKIIGATEKKPFFSNVGTPQGDSLSPVLFTIYLEHALKEVRPVLPKPLTPLEKVLPREIAYADNVDFVAFEDIDIEEVGKVLEKYNLQVNVDKTEFTNLSRGETNWQTTKKVGTLIGDQENIERRKQLSSAALLRWPGRLCAINRTKRSAGIAYGTTKWRLLELGEHEAFACRVEHLKFLNMEQNHLNLGPPQDATLSQLTVQASPIDLQTPQSFEVKLEEQPVHIEQVFEQSKDPKLEPEEGEVQVIYLNVPDTEEPQVLDLSSLLAQQGIQVVDQTEIQTIDAKDGANVFRAEDIIIEEAGDNTNITVVEASQSEAQSAHALLNLANVQAEESSVQVSEILAAQRQAQEEEEVVVAYFIKC
ncbi:very-long-chain enoyl-CoA reductase [Elysia marginata]|uniref:Very-long-chain enoyl-CoA reductase n=1 Tax=Elysia marginata TaxID=1093978 RepID=A0AAV4H6B6_9GAST|nr:very-long-chain enoyl-CoA reductase [Elysia marginata]